MSDNWLKDVSDAHKARMWDAYKHELKSRTLIEDRIASALEKLADKQDSHDHLLCTRCKNRCSSCDKALPVLPELPEMWTKAIKRLVKGTPLSHKVVMNRLQEEFEAIAIEQGYEKCTHGLWVDQEFLKANPHRRVKADG